MASILCWLFAQAPQLYKNYKNKQAEALSCMFLIVWLFGDLTNLIGSLLSHQLPTQIWTAIYFCMIDVVLVGQYLYYTFFHKLPSPELSESENTSASESGIKHTAGGLDSANFSNTSTDPERLSDINLNTVPSMSFIVGILVLLLIGTSSGTVISPRKTHSRPVHADEDANTVGEILGWISAALYVSSRPLQIRKNYKRKSVEGLSPILFICAFLGNLTYGSSVLLRLFLGTLTPGATTESEFIQKLPWLIGSLGTMFFDGTIFLQFVKYSHLSNQNPSEVIPSDPLDLVDSIQQNPHFLAENEDSISTALQPVNTEVESTPIQEDPLEFQTSIDPLSSFDDPMDDDDDPFGQEEFVSLL